MKSFTHHIRDVIDYYLFENTFETIMTLVLILVAVFLISVTVWAFFSTFIGGVVLSIFTIGFIIVLIAATSELWD